MTATNHGLMGALLATQVFPASPIIALGASFCSHFLLDALPHYADKKLKLKSRRFVVQLSTDALAAILTTLYVATLYPEQWLLVIACASVAASPDLAWFYYYYLKPHAKRDVISRFHSVIQWSQTRIGLSVEFVWCVAVLSFLVMRA